ncbi:aminotransferase class I/II-fold pyridoxal phosphate-dependent enzyme [Sulfurimonas sp.]|uniref:aminotransferase class I/II-fold pyridoxal phosphate-dependent enzyme n=1 Tax=Sulfurimonas sp. TaxID=2022749 RepID=UPI00356A0ED1
MKHGANIYKYAKVANCKVDEIIDFSSNINLYQPKCKVKTTNDLIVKYGDTSYKDLKKIISKNYGVKKTQISLFNGATSAIFALLNSLKLNKVYLYVPLYGEYEKAIPKTAKIKKIDRFKNIYKTPEKNSTVIFVNPSTPDGKYYDLKKLFKIWQEQNCTVILDESFLEFENLPSLRQEINNYKKLYIIQSFSKFFSCAGVRIGAVFSDKANIKKLKQPIWNLSSFDAEFLTQRLNDKKFVKKTRELHKKQKKELKKTLKNSKLFSKVYESDSNFFLVKNTKKTLFKYLLKHKILVRTCGSFDNLSDNYLRFAVKDKVSHKKLKEALREFHD